eukprot:5625486-Prymnesium_polylepis.1
MSYSSSSSLCPMTRGARAGGRVAARGRRPAGAAGRADGAAETETLCGCDGAATGAADAGAGAARNT